MEKIWIAVVVENSLGIRGIHYVAVSKNLVNPEANASNVERDKGYDVITAYRVGGVVLSV